MPRFGGFIGSPDTRATMNSKLGRYLNVRVYFVELSGSGAGSWTGEMQTGMWDGTIPLITLEHFGATSLADINAGTYDSAMVAFRDAMRSWIGSPSRSAMPNHKVWIRPLHEFNGNWYPWSGPHADWTSAWNRIYDIFMTYDDGASVFQPRMVWCPNCDNVGNELGTAVAQNYTNYWPDASHQPHYGGPDAYAFYNPATPGVRRSLQSAAQGVLNWLNTNHSGTAKLIPEFGVQYQTDFSDASAGTWVNAAYDWAESAYSGTMSAACFFSATDSSGRDLHVDAPSGTGTARLAAFHDSGLSSAWATFF